MVTLSVSDIGSFISYVTTQSDLLPNYRAKSAYG